MNLAIRLYLISILFFGAFNLSAQAGWGMHVRSSSPTLLFQPAEAPTLLTDAIVPFVPRVPDSLPPLSKLLSSPLLNSPHFSSPHSDLAFFCRLEVQLEGATRMPVRFRLGSTQYVDYLEGKFEGWRYGY